MLCCAVLCCHVLCCAVLCCAVLCYAINMFVLLDLQALFSELYPSNKSFHLSWRSVCPPACLSVGLSVCLSVHLSICLSVCLIVLRCCCRYAAKARKIRNKPVQNRNKMGALRQEVEMLRKQNQEYQVGSTLLALLPHVITVIFLGIWSWLQAMRLTHSAASCNHGSHLILVTHSECAYIPDTVSKSEL